METMRAMMIAVGLLVLAANKSLVWLVLEKVRNAMGLAHCPSSILHSANHLIFIAAALLSFGKQGGTNNKDASDGDHESDDDGDVYSSFITPHKKRTFGEEMLGKGMLFLLLL
jgi:hypothetical protein